MIQWKKLLLICLTLLVFLCLSGVAAAETADEKAAWVAENYTNSDMTEEEKALALHDWLTDNAYYDIARTSANRNEAAGVLLDGTGVCDSYAKAYVLLLSKVGIEAKRVTGEAVNSEGKMESHAWNLVKLAGKWYQVDVTWDDPVNPSNPTAKQSGLEHHLYFKASKHFMNEEHIPDEESAELINRLVADDEMEPLPNGVDHSAKHALSEFNLVTAAGQQITEETVTGKDMILVYGRITCGNTRAFLSDISPYVEHLSRKGIEVIVALYDDPSAAEINTFASNYPGVICAKITSDDGSMWEGLYAFNMSNGSVVFPVIFLKNKSNELTYCSTNYVENPLAIVAGALDMAKSEGGNSEPDVIDNSTACEEGHTVVIDEAKEATCTETGLTEGKHCSVCNLVLVKQEIIHAKGHTESEDKGKTATCTETGLTDGKVCSVCGMVLVEKKQIDALGHDWDEGKVTKEATYSENGIRTFTCKRCGETKDEEISIKIHLGKSGWVENGDGSWSYGDSNGDAVVGPVNVGGVFYCFNEQGKMITGWAKVEGKWYYAYSSGALANAGWTRIGTTWYFFRANGEMATGWLNYGGKYYYMKSDGTMATGWIEDHGDWYLLNKDGSLYTGWIQYGKTFYLLKPSGAMATGWYPNGGIWYYFKSSGAMAANEWIEDAGFWYWFDKNGVMATGWKQINGKWELFADTGVWMYTWDGK